MSGAWDNFWGSPGLQSPDRELPEVCCTPAQTQSAAALLFVLQHFLHPALFHWWAFNQAHIYSSIFLRLYEQVFLALFIHCQYIYGQLAILVCDHIIKDGVIMKMFKNAAWSPSQHEFSMVLLTLVNYRSNNKKFTNNTPVLSDSHNMLKSYNNFLIFFLTITPKFSEKVIQQSVNKNALFQVLLLNL